MSDFKSKCRQEYLEEFFYNEGVENCFITNEATEEIVIEIIEEGKVPDPYPFILTNYELISYYYTGGEPIEKILPLLEEAINYVPESFRVRCLWQYNADGVDEVPENAAVFGKYQANDHLYNLLGLCILHNRIDLVKKLIEGISVIETERAVESLIAMVVPEQPVADEAIPRPFNYREELKRAIDASTREETLKYLTSYLKAWYTGMKKIGWQMIDTHLNQEPDTWGYYGYWSFEAAAVAYLKEIDDASLRTFIYYPKDMVDYARKHFPLNKEGPDNKLLPDAQIWGGHPATYTGKWICPLMLENAPNRIQYFKKGDILPAGESPKGTFVWQFLGEK